jgi:hypothetical protein
VAPNYVGRQLLLPVRQPFNFSNTDEHIASFTLVAIFKTGIETNFRLLYRFDLIVKLIFSNTLYIVIVFYKPYSLPNKIFTSIKQNPAMRQGFTISL